MAGKSERAGVAATALSVLQRLLGGGESGTIEQEEARLGFAVPRVASSSLARVLRLRMLWRAGNADESAATPSPVDRKASQPQGSSPAPARRSGSPATDSGRKPSTARPSSMAAATSPPVRSKADRGTSRERARWAELAEEDPERERREGESDEEYATRMRRMDEAEGVSDVDGVGDEHSAKAAARRAGAKAAQRRAAAIFASPAAAKAPDIAAELAFGSDLSARKAVSMLEKRVAYARRTASYAVQQLPSPSPTSDSAKDFARAAVAASEKCRPLGLAHPANRPSGWSRQEGPPTAAISLDDPA